jgi:nitroreductase
MNQNILWGFAILFGMLTALPPLSKAANAGENPTLTTIFQRKSVRHYQNKPLTREQLETLLRAGMAAPTAADKRPWAFLAIEDPTQLKVLAQILPFGKMLEKAGGAIVVCGLPSKSMPGIESQYWIQDCSAASENILLAAEAMGLGGVWIGVYPVQERVTKLKQALKLPENVIPLNVLSLGYPTGEEKPKQKYLPANIHWNQW